MEKGISGNANLKLGAVAIFTSDKRDFQLKTVKRDKHDHYVTTKVSIH